MAVSERRSARGTYFTGVYALRSPKIADTPRLHWRFTPKSGTTWRNCCVHRLWAWRSTDDPNPGFAQERRFVSKFHSCAAPSLCALGACLPKGLSLNGAHRERGEHREL